METCCITWFGRWEFMETMILFVFEVREMLVFLDINGIQAVETSCNISP